MLLERIPLPKIGASSDLFIELVTALRRQRLRLETGDILAIASKVVSVAEGRMVKLKDVKASYHAKRLARKWRLDARVAQVVVNEANSIFGGVNGFLLTTHQGFLTANAGADLKNSPEGTITLWPKNADVSARRLRIKLEKTFHCRIGVIIVDSRVTPLRLGTTGLAIGVSGFLPVHDERGKRDLYGRRVKVTQLNVADDIAASAHLLMGESDEKCGAVVVRGASIQLDKRSSSRAAKMPKRRCLIARSIPA